MNPDFWRGKKVFVTGHTGFKGGWLCLLLHKLGAEVQGYSLPPPTEPNLFTLARIADITAHQTGDIRDREALAHAIKKAAPDIVMHLAAQPLLRLSYEIPVETYETNVMGTVHVLEAARRADSVRAALIVTTDKCYENRETHQAYTEDDPMGGHDPYSSSKGCAELAVSAYGRSFFANTGKALATVRAGNVIGGGDWAVDRLMTDVIAALMAGRSPVIRHPQAVRPWQHVMEPLSGYLRAVEYLWDKMPQGPQAWNFGPDETDEWAVGDVVNHVCRLWGGQSRMQAVDDPQKLHEAGLLMLDSAKARRELGWRPHWPLPTALAMTVEWFRRYKAGDDMQRITLGQIAAYAKAEAEDSRKIASAGT